MANALPPLVPSSRDAGDDQCPLKVKPLPLLLSTRAPIVSGLGNQSPGARGAALSRPSTSQQPYHPGLSGGGANSPVGDGPASPASPGPCGPSFRTKYSRVRGLGSAGSAGSLAVEGTGALPAQAGRPGAPGNAGGWGPQDFAGAAAGAGAGPGAGGGGGPAVQAWGPPSVAALAAAPGSGHVALAMDQTVVAGSGPGPGPGSGGGAGGGAAWAASRRAAGPSRQGSRPALEGVGLGQPGRSPSFGTRPDTSPPPGSQGAGPSPDPLAATYPARGHSPGYVHAAAMNPPLAPSPYTPFGGSSGPTGAGPAYSAAPPEPTHPAATEHLPEGYSDAPPAGTSQQQAYPQQHQQWYGSPASYQMPYQPPPPQPTPAQILRTFHRTNLTPSPQPDVSSTSYGPMAASGSGAPPGGRLSTPSSSRQPPYGGAPSSSGSSGGIGMGVGPSVPGLPLGSAFQANASGGGANAGQGSLTGMASLILSNRPATSAGAGGGGGGPGAGRPRTRGGNLADLSSALQKSIAAGMGEWDLRADGLWGHPEIQERLLRGPLGPELLRNKYRMEERDIISLYRLLYSYSVGFFTDVEALVDRAVAGGPPAVPDRFGGGAGLGLAGPGGGGGSAALALAGGGAMEVAAGLRQELLENVFRAYASLWDEALMVVFDSEMASVLADKTAALAALDAGVAELEALKRENEQLQTRLADFVKQNIDNMLATRHMKQAANRLEGEVHSLNNANEQLVTNMAGHAVQVTQLERQLEAARAATGAAEERAAAAEAHAANLKGVVSEQNGTLSSQYFQIRELEAMVGELQDAVRHFQRRRAAALGLTGVGGAASPDFSEAGAGGAATPTDGGATPSGAASPQAAAMPDTSLLDADELERLLADKTRSFNLLHADYVVKMHELDDQRDLTAQLKQQVEGLKADVRSAEQRTADAKAYGDRYRARWEGGRMTMEDLEGANRKLTSKNAELIRSYWPLMTRLREAEADAAAARAGAEEARTAAAADRAAAAEMEAAVEATRGAAEELARLREEVKSHELDIPKDITAVLTEAQQASLRRFTRGCHRRVAHLNQQLVALVDQVAALRIQNMQAAGTAGYRAGSAGSGAGAGAAAGSRAASPTMELRAPSSSSLSGGQGPHPAWGSPALISSTAGGAASLPAGYPTGPAAEGEVAVLRAALAARDRWLVGAVKGMGQVMGAMENLMAKDWEVCSALRLEQQRRRAAAERDARKAARQAAAAAEGLPSDGSFSSTAPSSPDRLASPSRLRASSTAVPSASPSLAPGTFAADGAADGTTDGTADGLQSAPSVFQAPSAEPTDFSFASNAPQPSSEATPVPHSTPSAPDPDLDVGGDGAMAVASGRLAQLLGVAGGAEGVATEGSLLALDRGFERLADSAERLVEWAEGLLRRKEQTATFPQLKQRLDVLTRQLDAANAELVALRPAVESLRFSVRSHETRYMEMAANVAKCKQRADTAESRLATTEAQLRSVSEQHEEATTARRLLEGEYWKAKEVALEAEVTTGELKAGRSRALEAAARALGSMSALEKEARENREQRVALEADLVGYKAWVRHMEGVERKYRALLRELMEATNGLEERDRQLAELRDSSMSLQQQLRLKTAEATALDTRVRALARELAEERRAAAGEAAAARAAAAAQLDGAIRQAAAAEADAASSAERVAVLEVRLAEADRAADAARTAADAAAARLVPLTRERDRLAGLLSASMPLLARMKAAADKVSRRLTLLEGAVGGQTGSLDSALSALLGCVDGTLDSLAALAASAAGDTTPAVLAALEGLVGQLISTLSKGGKEPLQSLAVLKAQLARDDKELAALKGTLAALTEASEQAAEEAAKQRSAAATATSAAATAVAAAERDGRRAVEAEAAFRRARREAEGAVRELAVIKQSAEEARRQLERAQRKAAELDADLAAARSQRRMQESQAAAAATQRAELQRRAAELETVAARDREAAADARARAAAAEAAAAAATAREGEAAVAAEAERREATRLAAVAVEAVAAAEAARAKAVEVEQALLEMQSKHADMLRRDETIEEALRNARFDAETARRRQAEAATEAAEADARCEALQERVWALQVALQASTGEKEGLLRDMVDAKHGPGVDPVAPTSERLLGAGTRTEIAAIGDTAGEGAEPEILGKRTADAPSAPRRRPGEAEQSSGVDGRAIVY